MATTRAAADPAHTLAVHICASKIDDLSDKTLEATRRDALDTFGAMLGGSGAPGIAELAGLTGRWGGLEEATVAVLGGKMPAHHTALVNSAMGHALDFDDTFDKGGHVHPGTSVLAASLAVAESLGGVTGDRLMLAVTLGLDVSCRLGLAAHNDRGWHRTASFGIFGATAAAGKLLDLTQEQMVHAFGIAYSQAAGNRQCIVDGALTKRFQAGQAAHAAVLSAFLAREGFTGAANVFAGPYGFFPMYQPDGYDLSLVTKDLGQEYLGDRLSLKPYPCGRPTHTYIDAAVKLHRELVLGDNAIESVVVRTDPDTFSSRYSVSSGVARPQQQVEAQFSLPYLIGSALALGGVGIDQITAFNNPAVLAAAQLVKAECKDDAPKGWAEIQVVCTDGRSASVELEPPSGSPDNPPSTEQLETKFRDCAAHALNPVLPAAVDEMIGLIMGPGVMSDSRKLTALSLDSAQARPDQI
ncbi:MAG: MmgE/PrpD family protein [Chloroflexi bacterium]|nr:MmgE/PrpD family protein [Chloroflexota bacterium]MDA1271072.1 MmgE/PrpD family protein [Chloroflexota bacterium]